MNGSIQEDGRRGRRRQSLLDVAASLRQAMESLGCKPGSGHCSVCWKLRSPRVPCQQWDRVDDYYVKTWRTAPAGLRREGAVACKDCCIARLDGHRCEWWDLCWDV